MRPTNVVAALALSTVGLLTGCAGLQPGVAARVGDESIMVSEVNTLADGYCRAYERQLEGQGTVVPMEVVVENLVQTLTLTAVARQMAEEYGVTASAAYAESLAQLEQASEALEPEAAEAKVAVESGGSYVNDILESIGRQSLTADGTAEPSSEEAVARGLELRSEWLAENETEIDPQYAVELGETQPEFVDTTTSVAVSDLSRAGERVYLFGSPELTEEENQQLDDYARSLPESQRCG